MKRNAVLAAMLLLTALAVSACAPKAPGGQGSEGSNIGGSDTSMKDQGANAPEFLNDLGKTLPELKKEHPEGEFAVNLNGQPDSASACFGKPGAEYAYFFFGGQSGDFEKAMTEGEDRLKCAGFVTTAGVLFPAMQDDMSFRDFFALIGVEDYEYFGEDTPTAAGWLKFLYQGMEVMVNTNEAASGGGWNFTGAEIVKRSAPASIVDPERLGANQELADAVMFGGKSKYEPSEVKIEDEARSFLNVRVEKADRNGGTFTLENCGDQRITYSDRNFLEKQINGEWNGVVAYNQRTMTEPSYELEPQESIDYQTKWDGLDEGEYRYVVPFSVSGDKNGEVYHAAVSFTVEKVSLWERLTGRA